jgi:AbrB family transcriptional regulator (stage V sporulation protein T)
MKATGIVRRIDDLGRVVIPKEIRRTLRIREGDPLEIFTDREGEIILKKYSPIGELSLFAKQYAEVLAQTCGHVVCIADRDQIIAVAGGSKKEFIGKNISKQLDDAINEREVLTLATGDKQFLNIINEEMEEFGSQVIAPILCEGDAIGAVVILCKDKSGKTEKAEQKLAISAAGFLGRQMEN